MPDYRSKSWRWYGDDAAEPTTALANEDTLASPTTWAIKRLRCSIHAIRKYLYVCGQTLPGLVTRIDLTDDSMAGLSVGNSISPTNMLIDNTNSVLYAWGSSGIAKINLSTFTVEATYLVSTTYWVNFDSQQNVYAFAVADLGVTIKIIKLNSDLELQGTLTYAYSGAPYHYPYGFWNCMDEANDRLLFSAQTYGDVNFAGAAYLNLSDFTQGSSIIMPPTYRTLYPGLNAAYTRGFQLKDGNDIFCVYHNTGGSYHLLCRIAADTASISDITAMRANEATTTLRGISIDTTNDRLYVPAANGPDGSGNDRISKWSYANDAFTFVDEFISTDPLEQNLYGCVSDPIDRTQLYVAYLVGGGHDGYKTVDVSDMAADDTTEVGTSKTLAIQMGTNV